MKLTSRRYLATACIATATATVAASLLSLSSASASSPRLFVDKTQIQAAAGTCTILNVTPQDTFGGASTATETVTILLTESPSTDVQDLDFCVSQPGDPSYTADTPSEDPSYGNGVTFPGDSKTSSYKAGPGITGGSGPTAGGTPDGPDNAKDTTPSSGPISDTDFTQTNPNGVDRARYTYNGNTKQPIHVGVVGLTAGSGSIKAFFDNGSATGHTNNYTPDADEIQATTVNLQITAGGRPGTPEAAQAVTNITLDPVDDAGAPGAQQLFAATLSNSAKDPVRGIRPAVQVDPNGANPSANASCGDSDNNGVAHCSFTGNNPGTDTLTVYVNRANGTSSPDFGEVRATATRTTTKPAVAAAQARFVDMTPKNQTVVAGKPDTFTATITDVNGAPAQGVTVDFTESGPGSFTTNSATFTVTTDITGRARVRINTLTTEQGTETITATIGTAGTQCTQQAGAGTGSTSTTPAGRCSDTATNTITSATPSPTASPSPIAKQLTLTLDSPSTIVPGVASRMTARGLAGSAGVLRCYSRSPQNASEQSPAYFDARSNTLNSSGFFQFSLNPGTNTRCFVKYAGNADSDARSSTTIVQNVATNLSLSAFRDGVRRYHFQGTNLPRRAGQLITLYRYATGPHLDKFCVPAQESYSRTTTTGCTAIRTATAFTNTSNVWRINRTFTGSGQFYFVVRTSQTLTNAAGFSNQRLTIIH